MAASFTLVGLTIYLWIINICLAWDNDELELFDLVEEVNANFYDVLGVGQDASLSDIKKAYRKFSLQLHPDKNKAEDAEEKFRQLVAVYEVLKDEEKRKRYNFILVEGLPDWRTPVFYYRRARKMGFMELSVFLGIIITIGQYLVSWAVYIERRLTLEDIIDSKKKKEKKKKNKGIEDLTVEEELETLPRPHLLDLWPFHLSIFLFECIKSAPQTFIALKAALAECRKMKTEEEEKGEESETETVTRKPKRRKLEIPEISGDKYNLTTPVVTMESLEANSEQEKQQVLENKGGEWSEEELVLLAKAANKFPGGTNNRWEKIASIVGRSVEEVSLKSKEIKGTYTMNLSASIQGDVIIKPIKKNVQISDNIITTADNGQAVQTTEHSNVIPSTKQLEKLDSARRRPKPTKLPKTPERTLMISQILSHKEHTEDSLLKEARTGESRADIDVSSINVLNLNSSSHRNASKDADTWTQTQQMAFEQALRLFPKGIDRRWDRISEQIPGKSKEECILRFKLLAEKVKKKKEDTQLT